MVRQQHDGEADPIPQPFPGLPDRSAAGAASAHRCPEKRAGGGLRAGQFLSDLLLEAEPGRAASPRTFTPLASRTRVERVGTFSQRRIDLPRRCAGDDTSWDPGSLNARAVPSIHDPPGACQCDIRPRIDRTTPGEFASASAASSIVQLGEPLLDRPGVAGQPFSTGEYRGGRSDSGQRLAVRGRDRDHLGEVADVDG